MKKEYVVKNVEETQEVMASLCLEHKDVLSKRDTKVVAFVSKGWHGAFYYPCNTLLIIKFPSRSNWLPC